MATYSSYLCKEYKLDYLKDGIVKVHRKVLASNHSDFVYVWSRSGLSKCGFRQDINNAITSGVTATPIVSHQKTRIGFLIKVTALSLNNRSNVEIGYKINGLSPVKYRIQSKFSFIYNYKNCINIL